MQQRQMIEQQLQSLQNMSVPPININNNMTPSLPTMDYDFNGKWVENEDQARKLQAQNKPLVSFDNNKPMLYTTAPDGTFRKFQMVEVVDEPPQDNIMESRMSNLENKLDRLLTALGEEKPKDNVIIPEVQETPSMEPKTTQKGGRSK